MSKRVFCVICPGDMLDTSAPCDPVFEVCGVEGLASCVRVLVLLFLWTVSHPVGFFVVTAGLHAAENEANVRHVLDTYPCLRLVPAEPRVGGPGLTGPADAAGLAAVLGVSAAAAAAEPAWLSAEQARMVQRFYPGSPGQHDTIGFFAARFQKVASCIV